VELHASIITAFDLITTLTFDLWPLTSRILRPMPIHTWWIFC